MFPRNRVNSLRLANLTSLFSPLIRIDAILSILCIYLFYYAHPVFTRKVPVLAEYEWIYVGEKTGVSSETCKTNTRIPPTGR